MWNEQKKIYNGLLCRLDGRYHHESNIIKKAWRLEITNPRGLFRYQYLDGVRFCKGRLLEMKKLARGRRKVHLRNRLILAEERDKKAAYKGVKQTIEREETKPMLRAINQSVDDVRLGETYHV